MPFRIPRTDPGSVTLTDGGLETDLIYNAGLDLPDFAAFPLLDDEHGRDALAAYFRLAIETAQDAHTPFSLDTVTWRANPDWAARRGYAGPEFERIVRDAVEFARDLRDQAIDDGARHPILVCGVIGPRDDGYAPSTLMTAAEAREYHHRQIVVFADAGVDYAAAMTIAYPAEAIGIVEAAKAEGLPLAISFTVETDGRLPAGQTLRDALAEVDAATDGGAAYFGVNCAHPDHLPAGLDEEWGGRLASYRANGSRLSHAELDALDALDAGDPAELGRLVGELHRRMPGLTVLGGCCGTDDRHIRAIADAVLRRD
ncbi:homocysteine S-methyltransferase family protein [Schumannella luteola]|uniref:Homocysteine S-methyltransferase n=1 Tax=Schumannella luteola TaxID=472059 RepID=A0A852Y903_9MICO|nr:homocysteine S-methyltransferase [Schumannella luteola]TPX05765.1 homocysteine S-methyltransferase family protein [Schumannella luteola]